MKILALLKGDHRDKNVLKAIDALSDSSDQITLLNVVSVGGEVPLQESGEVLEVCTEFDLTAYHEQSNEVVSTWRLNKQFEEYEKLALVGSPAKIAISTAKKLNIDLVVSGAHITSGFEELLVDSFSSKLIREMDIPYLTVASSQELGALSEISIVSTEDLRRNQNLGIIKNVQRRSNATVNFVHVTTQPPQVNWEQEYEEVASSIHLSGYTLRSVVSVNIENVLMEVSKEQTSGIIAFSERHLGNWGEFFRKDNRTDIVNHIDHPILIY